MNDNYDDMIHMTRPQFDDFPPMPMSDRAAQFSPFAALVGYGDAVAETARVTDSKDELTEDEADRLDAELNRLLDSLHGSIDEHPEVRVTYFITDKLKPGGKYAEKTGVVRTYDSYSRELVFTDGMRVPADDISDIIFTDPNPGK